MGECKANAIQINLGTFRHNQTYPGIIQAYSGIFRALSHIYDEALIIFTAIIIFTNCNYFHKAC